MPGLLLDRVDWSFYLGILCLILNAVCWAAYSTLSRRLMNRLSRPLAVASYVTGLGTLALIPMSLTSDWGLVRHLQLGQWLSILYLAITCSCLGYFLWNFSLSRTEAVRAAVWLYLEPVAAFIGEALIFNSAKSNHPDWGNRNNCWRLAHELVKRSSFHHGRDVMASMARNIPSPLRCPNSLSGCDLDSI